MRTIRVLGACSAVLLSLVAVEPQLTMAAAGDEHWSPQFGIPGAPNLSSVQTLGWNRGRLYASG